MKKLGFLTIAFVACMSFMGCPYETATPISDPSIKADEAMFGKWSKSGSEEYSYSVSRADGFHYKIVKTKLADGEETVYYGFMSKVGDVSYMNLTDDELNSDDVKYYLYKVSGSEGKKTLLGVTDNITQEFSSSTELKSYISKYQDLEFFFDKSEKEVFYKED